MNKVTRGQLNEAIAAQAHMDLTFTVHAKRITGYRQQGLALLEGCNPWWFLRAYREQSLSALTYGYDLPADFSRIDGDSLGYGENQLTFFTEVEEIDRQLGPTWKRSTHAGGTPEFATLFGGQLWLGPKPNAAFVNSYPVLDYYYYTVIDLENSTSDAASATNDTYELQMPTWMLPFAVRAAGIVSLQARDDPTWRSLLQQFYERDVMEMRAFDPIIKSNEPIHRPLFQMRGRRRLGAY
uniref:Uncharacterized protein n=1 Tax=viral metagenome TaxID=1070528 RepID=A0A6M3J0H7_9ZZZZ